MSPKFLLALCLILVSSASMAISGIFFHYFGAAGLLSFVLALTSSLAAILPEKRELLIRICFCILTLITVRLLGTLPITNGLGIYEFLGVWSALVVAMVAAVHLWLVPLHSGVVEAIRTTISKSTSLAYREDLHLWFLYNVAFWPILFVFWPFSISSVMWLIKGGSQGHADFGLHPISVIASGFLLPFVLVTAFVFSLRWVGQGEETTPKPPVWILNLKWPHLFASLISIYAFGSYLEYRSAKMYGLWTITAAILMLTSVNFVQLSRSLTMVPLGAPVQFTEETTPVARAWKRTGVMFLLLYFFSLVYYLLLSMAFRT